MKGCVYVIEAGEFYKIGKTTKTAFSRMRDLQTGSPVPLTLLCYIEHDDYAVLERELHRCFRRERVQGEWFRLEKEHVKRLCEMADWVRPLTKEERAAESEAWTEEYEQKRCRLMRSVRCYLSAKTAQNVRVGHGWDKKRQAEPLTFAV